MIANTSFTTTFTTNTTLQDDGADFYSKVWMLSQILSVLMTITCIWAIAAFYKYGRRKERWNSSNRDEFTLMSLAITTPSMTLLRLISTQIVLLIGLMSEIDRNGDKYCKISLDCAKILYTLSSLPTYLYYWKRQQVLYSQPLLSSLNTVFIKSLSYAAVFLIVGGSVGATALFLDFDNQMSIDGCISDTSMPESHHQVPIFIAGAILITAQLWIFALFVYPLKTLQVGKGEGEQAKPNDSLNKQLRGANVLATTSMAITTFSDLFVMVMVSTVVPVTVPVCLPLTIYDFSLMVNIFSLMLSNKDFKETVFSV